VGVLGEALFGLLLLCVPLATNFPVDLFPVLYLFAGKFSSACHFRLYDEQQSRISGAISEDDRAVCDGLLLLAIPAGCLCMCAPTREKCSV